MATEHKQEHEAAAEHMKGSAEKGEAKGGERKPAAKKGDEHGGHELHEIRTRFTKNGAAIHEHSYKDKHGNTHPDRPEYVSANMDDLNQHMQEHAGPLMEGGQGEDQQGEDQQPQGDTPDEGGDDESPAAQ